eukprot:Awhi_evm1s8530
MNTWRIVSKNESNSQTRNGASWNFRIKLDGLSKSRLCYQGFRQIPGVDYFNSRSPVISKEAIRIVSVLCHHFSFDSYQIDFKGAYTNADLDVELMVSIPQGFHLLDDTVNNKDHIMIIDKAKWSFR